MLRVTSGSVLLFQYGSNMSPARLNASNRLSGRANAICGARLDNWGIRFDLYGSQESTLVADIVSADGESAMGVLYAVPESDLVIMDAIEGVKADGTGNLNGKQ